MIDVGKQWVVVILAAAALGAEAWGGGKAGDKWFEHEDCKLMQGKFQDGDSFVLEWKDEKGGKTERTYRLYGVDCPESDGDDGRIKKRIEEQAKHWKADRDAVLAAGKEASKFTAKLLKRGKVRILTRGVLGQEVPKQAGRPQRRYALVEVLDDDGKPRWLHELLLEAGLARAYGKPAAWPPQEEDRHGEEAAERDFAKKLKRMERPLWGKGK
ncbi:MAG: thermonuclease family protein [Verrucomicrobia bacterium]|nr:thermonuclease family protein [Verrucomicrobiota bacterium]MDA1006032.1 thermonuclease family protein [Verrucomicrobiota bacterium]